MNSSNNKLHLGCGAVNFSGWINIDLDSPSADMLIDLTQPLPFLNNSASCIYSEHFIEHITRKSAVEFLIECNRVLIPGGVMRISTPNLRFLINMYLDSALDEWGDLWQPSTACAMMNEGMQSWGHQYIYDAEELVLIFKEAGFGSVAFQNYQESIHTDLVGLESRPFHHELIIEATKCEGLFLVDFKVLEENEKYYFQQNIRLDALEKTVADQKINTHRIETELAVQNDLIEQHKKTIETLERNLKEFENSWYGKLKRVFKNKWSNN